MTACLTSFQLFPVSRRSLGAALCAMLVTACSGGSVIEPTRLISSPDDGAKISAAAEKSVRRPAMARDAQRTRRGLSEAEDRASAVSGELLDAARAGDLDTVKAVFKSSTVLINSRDGANGETLLSAAIDGARVEVVRFALDQGADPMTKGPRGGYVLNTAIQRGYDRIALLLLDAGALADYKNDSGNTPLHDAAQFNRPVIAQALVARGADLEARNRQGWPPLIVAVRQDHTVVAQVLLDAGANPNARGRDSFTPLYWAVFKRSKLAADMLVKAGAQVGTMSLNTLD